MEGASVMRLFLAILFEEPVKDRLCEAMELIRRSTRTSRLTRRENLHLTLVFLGELREAGKVREVMEEIRTGPFPLEIRGLGRFQRDGGDLYWAGIEPSLPLQNLYLELKNALAGKGIAVEDRPYRPHLTLARQAGEARPGENYRRISHEEIDFSGRYHGRGKKLGMQGASSKADAVGMAGWGLVLEFKSL